VKDAIGRGMTPVETKILRAYRQVVGLLSEPDLAPTAVANVKEAAACLWILANELGLPAPRPDEHRL
jgi:hypothetical protein